MAASKVVVCAAFFSVLAALSGCTADIADAGPPGGPGPASGGAGGSPTVGGFAGQSAGGASGGSSAGSSGSGGSVPTAGSAGVGGAGSGGVGPSSTGCGLIGETGMRQVQMTSFGLERGYYLSVPDDYDSSVPHRLVFGYHGSNYTGIMMRQYLELEEAPLTQTIFVYPDGLPLDGQPDHIAWELEEEGRDIAFFDDLLAKLNSEYCIDQDRIFVNGQSFGGLMTNFVGCMRGDVVRAIAVVAGSGPRSDTCQGQVAAWLTHGMDDESVDFESGEASRDHWIEANHCTMDTLEGDPAQCLNYQGCDAGYPVIWCPHVNDGGHQHPSFGREAVREFLASF